MKPQAWPVRKSSCALPALLRLPLPLLPVLLRTAACNLSALALYFRSVFLSNLLTLPISAHDLRPYLLTSYCGRPGLNSLNLARDPSHLHPHPSSMVISQF